MEFVVAMVGALALEAFRVREALWNRRLPWQLYSASGVVGIVGGTLGAVAPWVENGWTAFITGVGTEFIVNAIARVLDHQTKTAVPPGSAPKPPEISVDDLGLESERRVSATPFLLRRIRRHLATGYFS
jgi:hypothetical protein